jgi:hypothetical protein
MRRGCGRGLSAADTDKLDEYLQSIRDIETRLAKEKQWLTVPKPAPAGGLGAPKEGVAGKDEIKVMYDIMVAALQTDSTRVITYRQPVGTLLKGHGHQCRPTRHEPLPAWRANGRLEEA